MKTIHLTNSYHPTSGGIRTFYRAWLGAADRLRHDACLIVPGARSRMERIGSRARIYEIQAPRAPFFDRRYRLILPHRFLAPFMSQVVSILKAESPDLIEITDKYSLFYLAGLIRKRLVRLKKRPCLVGLSCERMDDNVSAYLGLSRAAAKLSQSYLRRLYIPLFDHHMANSDYTLEELRQAARGHFRGRFRLCPTGVETSGFSSAHVSATFRGALLSKAGWPKRARLLLYVGRLSPEKNLSLLLDAVERLGPLRGADYRLLIAGSGPSEQWLRREIACRMPGRVLLVGQLTARADLASLYANCDVFVHPNPREPFGIAPLEAMASGLPVVAPNRGGVLTYASAENAWLAAPDAEDFANAICDCCDSPDDRRGRVEAARRTAEDHRWEAVLPRLLQTYEELASQGWWVKTPKPTTRQGKLEPSADHPDILLDSVKKSV
jgi:alpha-1,6-mannosyltransferase